MSDRPLPPAELRARILSAARAEPAPSRGDARRQGALALAAGMAASALVLLGLGGPTAGTRPGGYFVTLAVLWTAVGVAATWAGLGRGRSMLGRPASVRLAVAVATPLALTATAVVAGLLWPGTLVRAPDVQEHLACLPFTVVLGLGPLAAFGFLRRHSDPIAPRLTGAALGAASGAWGALCIELVCTHASLAHVVLAHVVPVVALALAGAALGDRLLALRAASAPTPPV